MSLKLPNDNYFASLMDECGETVNLDEVDETAEIPHHASPVKSHSRPVKSEKYPGKVWVHPVDTEKAAKHDYTDIEYNDSRGMQQVDTYEKAVDIEDLRPPQCPKLFHSVNKAMNVASQGFENNVLSNSSSQIVAESMDKGSSQNFTPQKVVLPKENKGRALDLFTGTGSVAKRLREIGYEVMTLDMHPKAKAQITCDLLDWDYKKLSPRHFKLICASIPCAEYSVAKTTAPRNFAKSDALVYRALENVDYFLPEKWWIENPQTVYLKDRPMMRNITFVDIEYC